MNATSLKALALAASLGAVIFGSACDPPALPPATPDKVYTNPYPQEVKGLHRVLKSIKNLADSEAMKELVDGGHVVRMRLKVNTCPDVNNAYTNSWVCYTRLTGIFRLKNKFHNGIDVGNGRVSWDQDAAGDLVKFTEDINYSWDAAAKQLYVWIRYPASTEANLVRYWGRYSVRGTSNTKITTQSSSESAGFTLSYPNLLDLSAAVEKTQFAQTSFVRVRIEGNPYWADTGSFNFTRQYNPGGTLLTSDFTFGQSWFTDAVANLQRQVIQFSGQCSGQHMHSGSFNGKLEKNGIGSGDKMSVAVQYKSGSSAECKTWTDTLAANLHYQASNAFSCGNQACTGEAVGERFVTHVLVENLLNGNCKHKFFTGFDAVVNWGMSLVASNGQTGNGFDIGSGKLLWNQASDTTHVDTYSCN